MINKIPKEQVKPIPTDVLNRNNRCHHSRNAPAENCRYVQTRSSMLSDPSFVVLGDA